MHYCHFCQRVTKDRLKPLWARVTFFLLLLALILIVVLSPSTNSTGWLGIGLIAVMIGTTIYMRLACTECGQYKRSILHGGSFWFWKQIQITRQPPTHRSGRRRLVIAGAMSGLSVLFLVLVNAFLALVLYGMWIGSMSWVVGPIGRATTVIFLVVFLSSWW